MDKIIYRKGRQKGYGYDINFVQNEASGLWFNILTGEEVDGSQVEWRTEESSLPTTRSHKNKTFEQVVISFMPHLLATPSEESEYIKKEFPVKAVQWWPGVKYNGLVEHTEQGGRPAASVTIIQFGEKIGQPMTVLPSEWIVNDGIMIEVWSDWAFKEKFRKP